MPADQRHTAVHTTDMVEMGCVEGQFLLNMPDLILGDTLIEIKTSRKPSFIEVARQLAQLVLQDRYDRYAIRNVVVYFARQGVLLKLPVNELIPAAKDLASLEGLRERYRVARGQMEERLLILSEGDHVSVVVAFYEVVRRQMGFRDERDANEATTAEGPCWLSNRPLVPPKTRRKIQELLVPNSLTDLLDALRGLRVAVRYSRSDLAEAGLEGPFTDGRVKELETLTRLGPSNVSAGLVE